MSIIGVVFHWSAGRYDQVFNDYHYNITYNPKTKQAKIIKTCESDDELKAHTWHKNTGRIGIALACCYNATSENIGSYPPTEAQIEMACALAGRLIKEHGIKEDEVKSHAEWATIDGYGPGSGDPETRWDLWIPNWKNGKNLSVVMRDKALWYAEHGEDEELEDKKYNKLVNKYSQQYNLRPEFVHSIIQQESSYNPKAVSKSNAKGLMQLLPATFTEVAKKLCIEKADPFNPETNIRAGCYYLDWCRKNMNVEWSMAAGYNQGIGNFKKGTMPADGLDYANEVMERISQPH